MRKVLSFVLVLALVLGSFSMAFGLTDIAESDNSEAITVANDLGIITGFPDGTFKPDQAVNRAEFAAMITRALAIPDSALAAYTATSFKDTAGYGWAVPYLAFCESKGIMLGDGMGNAMPGRTISVNEAITMAARAIGYTENSAMLVGSWPANYVTLGQTLGLYDDVATATTISRESAAQVIYNSLTVDMVTVNTDGKTEKVNGGGTSMLTAGLGAAQGTAMVIVGTEDSDINLQKYVGAYVIPFTKDGDIIAMGDVKSTFLTGTYDTTTQKLDVDGVEYSVANTVTVDAVGYEFTNGLASVKGGTGLAMGTYTDVTLAVAKTGKTIDTVYSIATWTAPAGGTFLYEEDMLTDKALNNFKFALTEDDAIDYEAFSLLGVDSLEDIAEDNVVYVYTATIPGRTPAGATITKIEVGTDVVSGQIEKYVAADTEYYIGGNAYTDLTGTMVVGDTGTALLDYFGDVYDWDIESGTTGNYALLLASKAAIAGYDNGEVKLFTKAGEEVSYPAKDATIMNFASGAAAATLVKFDLNSAGKVTTLVAVTMDGNVTLKEFNAAGTIIDGKAVASDAVVFVKDTSATNEYSLGSVADINKESNITFTAAYDGKSKIQVIVIDDTYAGGANDTLAVVNAIDLVLNADGDKVQKLTGFAEGVEFTALTDDDTTVTLFTVTSAGLVKLTMNDSGVVTADATNETPVGTTATSVSVAAIDGKNIRVSDGAVVAPTWVALTDNVVVYALDDDGEYWEVKNVSYTKNKTVNLYKSDSDLDAYDIVIAW